MPLKYRSDPIFGFTYRAPGRALELGNKIHVSEAYDVKINSGTTPNKISYDCIWDTGATGSVITKKVVDELGLQPSGKVTVEVVGPSETDCEYEADTYLVNLYLPPHVVIVARVSEGHVGGCDVLLGMDVIGLGDFAVTNHNKKTTWSFRLPSCYEIDFVKEIEDYNRRYSPDQARKDRNKRKAEKHKYRK